MTIEELITDLQQACDEAEEIIEANNTVVVYTQGYFSGLTYALEQIEKCREDNYG